jgi:hypothetical protein
MHFCQRNQNLSLEKKIQAIQQKQALTQWRNQKLTIKRSDHFLLSFFIAIRLYIFYCSVTDH